jgi:hypothetical protein
VLNYSANASDLFANLVTLLMPNLMKNSYLSPHSAGSFNCLHSTFVVSYKDVDGTILHGYVTQLSKDDFEVYIKEKEVIIQCKKDESGIVSCKLNSKRNVPWIEGISNAVARNLLEQ